MKETIVIDGANFRKMLLSNAKISPKDMSLETGRDISQISRFLRGERWATEKVKKTIYRMYKKKRRGTPIIYDRFWTELIEIAVVNCYPG